MYLIANTVSATDSKQVVYSPASDSQCSQGLWLPASEHLPHAGDLCVGLSVLCGQPGRVLCCLPLLLHGLLLCVSPGVEDVRARYTFIYKKMDDR